MRSAYVVLLAAVLLAGCATHQDSHLGPTGDVELVGPGTVEYPGLNPRAPWNFIWDYDTEGWRDVRPAVFHRMHTVLRLGFDVETGEIGNVSVESSQQGHALRHVCLTPGPEGSGLLMIRMTTLLDDRDEDLTVLKVHTTDVSTHMCEEIGVGPIDGLVEGVNVLFKEDGTFTVLPNTGAYLAGAGLGMERKMTVDPERVEVDVDVLP
jgi:hypothetical protein